MKEPSATSSPTLGHLAAFTLGIICMGSIMFFTSRNGLNQSPPASSTAPPSGAEPGKSHFQRSSASVEAPIPPAYRGTLKHQADLKSPQVAAAPEQTVPEEIIPPPQPTIQTVVHQPVTLVAD